MKDTDFDELRADFSVMHSTFSTWHRVGSFEYVTQGPVHENSSTTQVELRLHFGHGIKVAAYCNTQPTPHAALEACIKGIAAMLP